MTVGAEYQLLPHLYLGASGAYSYTNIDWHRKAGKGDTQSGYTSLYAAYCLPRFYVQGAVTGAYNSYFGKRNIEFTRVDRKARSHHGGGEMAAYVGFGGLFQIHSYLLQPYASADYIYLHEGKFHESGAQTLNLQVQENNSSYLRGEAGLMFSGWYRQKSQNWKPALKFGAIREWRFLSRHYTAKLEGVDCSFTVTGLRPDRTLWTPGASLTVTFFDEKLNLSVAYDGEFGHHYSDNSVQLQAGYSF